MKLQLRDYFWPWGRIKRLAALNSFLNRQLQEVCDQRDEARRRRDALERNYACACKDRDRVLAGRTEALAVLEELNQENKTLTEREQSVRKLLDYVKDTLDVARQSHRETLTELSNTKEELTAAHRALNLSEAEVERLRKLGIEQAEKAPIVDIDVDPSDGRGGVQINVRPPEWLLQSMAAAAYDLLADAENWRSWEVGPMDHEGTVMLVTVQRQGADTPENTVGKLRTLLKQWYDCFRGERNGFEQLEAETLTAINPTTTITETNTDAK